MRSRMAIGDHPIHPMLVPLAIGLFAWTLAADIIYVATGQDHMWYDIAFWSGIGGIVCALVAALPGLGDYITVAINSEARGHATAHMFLNLMAVALFIVAMLIMRDDGALDGSALVSVIVLHAIANAGLAVSGWLGGEMVYRYRLGVLPAGDGTTALPVRGPEAAAEERRRAA